MTCTDVRHRLLDYAKGEIAPDDAVEFETHLSSCPACRAESAENQTCLGLLDCLPEIDSGPEVWSRIQGAIRSLPARRARPLSGLLRFAAAASVAVAVISFLFVTTRPRSPAIAAVAYSAPGSGLALGQALGSGETFTAPSFVRLALPDVGRLTLEKGTRIEFRGPREVRLHDGQLFAEILPAGAGFRVVSPDTNVTVRGTRFGVRAGGSSRVYVVEGRVEVESGGRRLLLSPREMAVAGGPAQPLEDGELRWLAGEPPEVALVARLDGALRQGEEGRLRLEFHTTSAAPVVLPPLDELLPRLHVRFTDPAGRPYIARLAPEDLLERKARLRGPRGPVLLDVSAPCLLTVRIAAGLLPAAGNYTVAAAYQPEGASPEAWSRAVDSEPHRIEVLPCPR